MRTFNEFIDYYNYMFDTPEAAISVAQSFGGDGYHQHDDKFMPMPTHDEWLVMLKQIKMKKTAALDLS